MRAIKKWNSMIGLTLHLLIGGVMLVAGSFKVLGLYPPEVAEKLGPLSEQLPLIGAAEILTAFLLVMPRTSSLGVLLTSSLWGGAICLHMRQGEPYGLVAALLVLSWL